MEAFYSVIYYKTNTMTDERVAIGLFCGGGEGPFLFLSNHRLRLLKNTIHPNTFLATQRHLKALKKSIDDYRSKQSDLRLFDPKYASEIFNDLSKSLKGALVYSEPTVLNEWLNHNVFDQLVSTFLGEQQSSTKSKKKQRAFHFKWRAIYNASKFDAFQRNVPLNQFIETTAITLKWDLVNPIEKKVYKGLDFDLTEHNVALKINTLELAQQLLEGYTVSIVYPNPRTKKGSSFLNELKEKNMNFKLIPFKTVDSILK